MRLSFLTLAFSFMCPLTAKSESTGTNSSPNDLLSSEFIRVTRDIKCTRLQTAITKFTRGEIEVDLIAAVHIADKKYYENLNNLFKNYPSILFEMVGGEGLGKGNGIEDRSTKTSGSFGLLDAAYQKLQKTLNLSGQKENLDYSAENFIHADLTIDEYNKLNQERKQSLVTFLMGQTMAKSSSNDPSSVGLLMALLNRNSSKLKLQLVDYLAEGDNNAAKMSGPNVIISDRNIKCLAVMNNQLEAGLDKLGIFYGAAHLPDMEKRLIDQGFVNESQIWMDAWTIPNQ